MHYKWLKIKRYIFPVTSFVLTLLTALFWVALRINHSGISKFLGADTNPSFLIMNLPLMVTAAAWLAWLLAFWGLTGWEKRKWPGILGFLLGLVFAAAAVVVVIFGAKDYLRFILPHFLKSAAVAACICAFALLLYFPIRGRRGLKALILIAVILAAVGMGYHLRPCVFRGGAVVYAVEDDYQIVFSTTDSAIAWVEIGGECYYDLYAGSMKSADRVHKIEVPQTVLDAAGSYSIHAKQMIYRGPFGGYTGPEISESYSFRPVDTTDGLTYFALSDVHESLDAAVSAARGEYDFLVLLGDIVSMVETEADARMAGDLAHRITGGEIPVIYVRGNHEIKGEYAEDFWKYVGAKGQDYYYSVTLGGDVFAVVLDLGEDHEDDWWEYYGTAQFDLYRAEQTRMLEEILESGEYENYSYRMALSHIPVVYVNKDGLFGDFRREWTELLNEMEIDISLSGHQHELFQFLPGTLEPETPLVYTESFAGTAGKQANAVVTDHSFPAFLTGNWSQREDGRYYIGMEVQADLDAGTQTCRYTDSDGQTVEGAYAFEGNYENAEYTEFVLKLRHPRHKTVASGK